MCACVPSFLSVCLSLSLSLSLLIGSGGVPTACGQSKKYFSVCCCYLCCACFSSLFPPSLFFLSLFVNRKRRSQNAVVAGPILATSCKKFSADVSAFSNDDRSRRNAFVGSCGSCSYHRPVAVCVCVCVCVCMRVCLIICLLCSVLFILFARLLCLFLCFALFVP